MRASSVDEPLAPALILDNAIRHISIYTCYTIKDGWDTLDFLRQKQHDCIAEVDV